MIKPLLDNEAAKKSIPWEPVGQVKPEELPDEAPESHPAPWKVSGGNGHLDIVASNGEYVAHVYIWDEKDWEVLEDKLKKINNF